MVVEDIFGPAERKRLAAAITTAENLTSGEIRLHVDSRCNEDVLDQAAFIFEELEMHKTKLRNGVLFYVALNDRKFAILGDGGINDVVPKGFWDEVRDTVVSSFKESKYVEGLEKGLIMAGEQLKNHFPLAKNDKNELSNEVTFGSTQGEK